MYLVVEIFRRIFIGELIRVHCGVCLWEWRQFFFEINSMGLEAMKGLKTELSSLMLNGI